jgi:hypothetical protein
MFRSTRGWAAALMLSFLTACGGGGGGASESAPPTARVQATAASVQAAPSGNLQAIVGASVTLDASGSSASSAVISDYSWSVLKRPSQSVAEIVKSGPAVAQFTPDLAGDYVVSLQVTDSNGGKATTTLALTAGQALPAASVAATVSFAGPVTSHATSAVVVNSLLILDGTDNVDANGRPLALSWAVVSAPAGSASTVSVRGRQAEFRPDVPGKYVIRLRGTNVEGAFADALHSFDAVAFSANVAVSTSLNSETAVNSLRVALGSMVIMDGAQSAFGSGDYTAEWKLTGQPLNSTAATLSSTATLVSSLTPDVVGEYVVEFNLKNLATGFTSRRVLNVSVVYGPEAVVVAGAAPVGSGAVPTFVAAAGQLIKLRGSGSYDLSGAALSYAWTLTSSPYNSNATLSSTSTADVDFTPDTIGTYTFDLVVTSSSGLVSRKSVSLQVGAFSPVVAVDNPRATALVGSAATVSAAASYDPESRPVSFSWALDSKPTGSSVSLTTTNTSTLSLTPDLLGTYVASLTVSNGVLSTVSTVTVNALAATSGTVPLGYRPVRMKYSKTLDRAVILSANPNVLHIVDVTGATDLSVPLPASVKDLSLSPNGELAAVMHEGTASLIDLRAATLVRTSRTFGTQNSIAVGNNGLLYLAQADSYSGGLSVINGYTGASVTQPTEPCCYSVIGGAAMQLSMVNNRLYTKTSWSSGVAGFTLDPSQGFVYGVGQISASGFLHWNIKSLWMASDESLVFTDEGPYYRASDLRYAGTLGTRDLISVSHSSSASEAVAFATSIGAYNWNTGTYATVYPAAYKRYIREFLFPDPDVKLPLIGGSQSYGLAIFHRSDDTKAMVIQVGSDVVDASGVQFYLVSR